MILSAIRTSARFYTNTDSTTYSDTDLDREANNAYDVLVMEIIKVQGYTNLMGEESETDLVSTDGLSAGDNGYNGEYAFPTDLLRPTRVELQYSDDDAPRPANVYDMSENSKSEHDEDEIQGQFNELEPHILFFRNAYKIRPLKTDSGDITDGIHIWYEARHDALSAAGDAPVFEATYHNLIPLKVAKHYALKYPKSYNPLWDKEYNDLLESFRSFYRNRLPIGKEAKPIKHSFK